MFKSILLASFRDAYQGGKNYKILIHTDYENPTR